MMITRLRYHAMRFKTAFWYGGGTLFFFMLLMMVAFPNDDEIIKDFIGILGDIGLDAALGINVDAPGFTLWLMLFTGTYLFMIVAVVSIRIGSRVLPTTEEDGMELLLGSQPKSGRVILVENWLGAQIALMVILLPTWIMISIFTFIYGAGDIIGRVLLLLVFTYTVGTFFLTFSMLCAVLLFSRSWGLRGGFFYFIYALIILLSAGPLNKLINDNAPDLGFEIDVGLLNVNLALDPASGLLENEWSWLEFIVVLILSLYFVLIAVWRVKSPDYTERVARSRNYLGFLPSLDSNHSFSRKYPLVLEQLKRDKGFLFVYVVIFVFIFPYEMVLFDLVYADDPQAFAELINGFDVGFFDVILGGYTLPGSYTGFAVSQFYALSWLYYSIFVFIVGCNIPNRDVSKETQDLIFGNPISQREVIFSRVVAMLIGVGVVLLAASMSNMVFGALFGFERNLGLEFLGFLLNFLYMTAYGILIVGLVMMFPVSKGKRIGFWFYLATIFVFLFAQLQPDLEFLKYLSVFSYFDIPGIILGEVEVFPQFLNAIILWLVAIAFFVLGLKQYEKKDMI